MDFFFHVHTLSISFSESKNLVVIFPTVRKQGRVSRSESNDIYVTVDRYGMQEKLCKQPQAN